MVPLCTQTAVSCPAILLWHRTVAGAPATDSEVFGRAAEGWPPGVGCGAVEQAGRARSVARPSKQARRARAPLRARPADAWAARGARSAIVEDLVAFFEDVGEGAAALGAPGGPLDAGAGDGGRFADLRALAEAIARAVERGDAPTLRRILESIPVRPRPRPQAGRRRRAGGHARRALAERTGRHRARRGRAGVVLRRDGAGACSRMRAVLRRGRAGHALSAPRTLACEWAA